MKRATSIVLAALLATATLGAPGAAAKKKGRVVVVDYEPLDGGTIVIGITDPGLSIAQVDLYPEASEKKISVEVEDELGLPVKGVIEQDGNQIAQFCGRTGSPISFTRGVPLRVELFSGPCGTAAATASSGTLTATFR